MRLTRLRGRKQSEQVLRKGNVWKGKTMLIRWVPGHPRNGSVSGNALYLGTYASSRLDASAVRRNRMRRRCREALRLSLQEAAEFGPVQALMTPKAASLDVNFEAITSDAKEFFKMLQRVS